MTARQPGRVGCRLLGGGRIAQICEQSLVLRGCVALNAARPRLVGDGANEHGAVRPGIELQEHFAVRVQGREQRADARRPVRLAHADDAADRFAQPPLRRLVDVAALVG
jgi:hypothetical protein